jgi:putative hydrolase
VKIAPRRFNPSHIAWLPVLHTTRGRRHYTALFSNTALAHRLNRTHDWVVIYWDDGRGERQYTVVTAKGGSLEGRRVVRGREAEMPQEAAVGAPPSHGTNGLP